MKFSLVKSAGLSLALLFGTTIGGAATVTVGPTGQYATPCAAFPHLADGDTVQIDANGGTPYMDTTDCKISNNNLTIVGVNGRPILDASNAGIAKGIWVEDGHDVVIDNFEFRNAKYNGSSGNAAGVRIEDGFNTPGGGNVTIQHCYIHDNGDGVLGGNVDATDMWYSSNPFITFQYDEFQNNGDGSGSTHNMYMGYGGNMDFTLQYSWSHDSFVGHTVKTRAPINNILYNLVGDAVGNTSYVLDFPLGGSTYIVGNVLYKAATTNPNSNQAMMIWRDVNDNGASDPEYGLPNEDLHFVNNTMVNDPANTFPPAFVNVSCFNSDSTTCSAPPNGPVLSVNSVVQNNIFVGPGTEAVNQPTAVASHNILEANTSANLAALFVDSAHLNYHLAPGSPAIQAGLYPPTNNAGASDPNALAKYEYVQPVGKVTRPTPSGSTMDAGAYSYPRVDTPPAITASATSPVTVPNTGTITVTGLPTPPAGQFNYVSFVSENPSAIPNIPSVATSTSSATATFQTLAVVSNTTVTIDVYANGAHTSTNVTVVAGPPVLSALTIDGPYYPASTVHLLGGSTSPVVINLSSSDPTILYVPSTVTIPAGQLTAETGSINGSLWGQSPGSKTATETAVYAGVTKTLAINVAAPFIHNAYFESATVVGGQQAAYALVMAGDYPPAGGPVVFTSDNTAVIPNQTVNIPGGNYNADININTNTVTSNTTVNVTINVNGSTATNAITVTPGGPAPASIAVVSGSGQSATVGTNFANPLVVVVEDSGGHPVSGATVTYAGSNVSFPSGATAVTNASGQASVAAQPTAAGALTVTASVSGVSTPASFSETGTASVAISSITQDNNYQSGTTVHLSAAAPAGGAVVTLSTSDSSILYTPASVTVPAGATSAETGTLLGSLWGQSPTSKPATLTATYNGAKTLTMNVDYVTIHTFVPNSSVEGGQPLGFYFESAFNTAPVGGGPYTISSDHPSIIPTQNYTLAAGQANDFGKTINTNTVTSSTTVNLTLTYNGATWGAAVTVTPGANSPASIAVVSGSGQTSPVGTNFPNPLVAVVKNSSGGVVSGATVTFAGSGVSFPSGATAVTNASGQASVTAQPTATGSLTVTASVSGVGTPASFAETGTASVAISSITLDSPYGPAMTVHLTAAAPAGGAAVALSTSDSSVLYTPATVTVPAGATSAEAGTQLGSLWGQSPSSKSATLTGNYGGVQKTLTASIPTSQIHSIYTSSSVVGGQPLGYTIELAFSPAPHGGAPVTFTSSNPAVIPNQSYTMGAGVGWAQTNLTTNTVSTATNVTITATWNGLTSNSTVTVNP